MKKLTTLLMMCFCLSSLAQDKLETSRGLLQFTPILHGAMVIEYQEKIIYVDPYGGAEKFNHFARPDIILITDIHGDHLHKKTLDGLHTEGAHFIVPQAVADQINEMPKKDMTILNNGERTMHGKISIKAIPMYNLPESEDSRHVKGRGNGYVIAVDDKKIYISGDTEDIAEMRNLKGIDVAFVCMNLPYTMTVEQAADAVVDFKPSIVYPYHFRGKGGFADVEKFKTLVNKQRPEIEVRLRNWYENQ